MFLFSSARERWLWFWTAVVVLAIYSTLGLAGRLAVLLQQRELLDSTFFLMFLMSLGVILAIALRQKPGRHEVWTWLGIIIVYAAIILRMGLDPAERTHLFEYGLVAALIYQALLERKRNGRRVPLPALLALLLTGLIGWLDEGIQAILPNRVYDLVDVGFNVIAAFMAIVASAILVQARQRFG